jgi:hypothetical protein
MGSVLASLVVTGLFMVVAAVVGRRIGRMGKPYGFVKSAIHITLFTLVLSGVIASIYKLQGLSSGGQYAQLSLYVTVLTLLTNLAVGAGMIIIKSTNRNLVTTHKVSTLVMAISIIASVVFVTAGM